MAKNIEMNQVDSSGSYETVYPMTKQELVIDLLNDDVKELMGLDSSATASDAFKTAYLSSVLSEKSMIEVSFTDAETGKPVEGIVVECPNFCDSAGTPLTSYTTNNSGVIIGFVNIVNPTISISNYVDIADFSTTLSVDALGKQYSFNYSLTTYNFKKYTASANVKMSGNVTRIDVTAVDGGGGGGGPYNASSSGNFYTATGGGGGYCVVQESVGFNNNTMYTLTVGAGGRPFHSVSGSSTNYYSANGGASSFLSVSANGGNRGMGIDYSTQVTTEGKGNGNGGYVKNQYTNKVNENYITYVQPTNGTVYGYSSFTETVLYGGGGGGSNRVNQDGSSFLLVTTATTSYGGCSRTDKNGKDGYGGGGFGYCLGDGGSIAGYGGSGCVAIRMHLKSRA